jgi:hypothetical protein
MYDKNLIFSDASRSPAAPATSSPTSSYDTWQGGTAAGGTPPIGGPLLNDIGRDRHAAVLQITEAVTAGGGAATIDFQLVQADDAALARTSRSSTRRAASRRRRWSSATSRRCRRAIPPGPRHAALGRHALRDRDQHDRHRQGSSGLHWDRETNTGGI